MSFTTPYPADYTGIINGLSLCYICTTAEEIVLKIRELFTTSITESGINKRRVILLKNVNNKHGA
ncbi:hypothetical protein ACFLSE_03865 [Bacteroidota bacterium]